MNKEKLMTALLNMIEIWSSETDESGEVDWEFLEMELGLDENEIDELIEEWNKVYEEGE